MSESVAVLSGRVSGSVKVSAEVLAERQFLSGKTSILAISRLANFKQKPADWNIVD